VPTLKIEESLATIHVGLEEGADGALIAHAFNLPGCAGVGGSPEDALSAFETELQAWLRFLAAAGEAVPAKEREIQVAVDEWLRTEAAVAAGESHALFADDLRPLEADQAELGVRRLGDLRGRLLAQLRRRPDVELDAPTLRGTSVRTVLEELARAQWWTLSRLGATPMAGAPDRTLARLDTAMALVVDRLTTLDDDARGRRILLDGEEWTPRKVLRRLLWLEWTLGGLALEALGASHPPAPLPPQTDAGRGG
jgi:predicted RNase H-like HicB family nuclease